MAKKFQKKIYQYTAVFEPAEEGGYTVTIPALPGCISEGDTFEKALANIREAAELYLEVMEDHSEPVPIEQETTLFVPLRVQISSSPKKIAKN